MNSAGSCHPSHTDMAVGVLLGRAELGSHLSPLLSIHSHGGFIPKMGSRAEQPNQLQGDPLGVGSVDLGTRLGSGTAGSLQPDPVASLPWLLHGHGGEDAGDSPRGGCVGREMLGDAEGSRWGAGLVPETPCSWRRRGDRCSQPSSVGMLPNPEANPPWQLCVSQSGDFLSAFWLRQVPAGASLCHPRAGQDGGRGCGGCMMPGTFGCPGAGFGTSHRQGGWRWDPQPTAHLGADPLKAGTGNLLEWGAI